MLLFLAYLLFIYSYWGKVSVKLRWSWAAAMFNLNFQILQILIDIDKCAFQLWNLFNLLRVIFVQKQTG